MNKRIIFFDGVCNLCNASVDFIIARDTKRHFRYASLQSDVGQVMLRKHNLPTTEFSTFLYLDGDTLHTKSSGALRVAVTLGGWYSLMGAFLMIPPFIRNAIYDLIAKHRYRWFGKRDTCRLPTPEERSLFLG